jgi:tetratricopeptide (TPR) repeat protein
MKLKSFLMAGLWLAAAVPLLSQSALDKGQEFLRQGRRDAALVELRQAAAASPKNPAAWFWLGEAWLQAAKLDSAAYAAQKLLALNDKKAEGYILSAKIKLAEKKFAEAKTLLRAGLKFDQQHHALLVQLGKALVASDSSDHAIIVFAQAQKAAPDDPTAYEALGDVYMQQGGSVVAIMQYEKALELDSLLANLHYKLAEAYMVERRYNEAARAYQRVIGLDTTNQRALFELAKLYFTAKKYDRAAQFLSDYVRRYPETAEAWPMFLEALYLSRQYREVLTAAPKVLLLEPDSTRALRMLAHAHFELREYEHAIMAYQQLGQKERLSADDLKRLGKAYVETRQDSLAVRALEEVVRQSANGVEVLNDLGAGFMRLRQFDKAAAVFEKKFMQDSTAVSAYVNYALSNMALQRWNVARRALYRALALKPDYVQGHLFLARTLMQMDSLQQAKRTCGKIVELAAGAPGNYQAELAEAQGYAGFVLLLDKRYPEAHAALSASIKLIDNNPQTRLWRAQALALTGRHEEAVAEYKIVLKLDPQNKEAKRNLALLTQ